MIRLWLKFVFLLFLLVASCKPETIQNASPIPTPNVWLVSFPPELAWIIPEFSACIDPEWNTGIVIEESQMYLPGSSQADVFLIWGDVDPGGVNAYLLGEDGLRLVVNPDNPISEMDFSTVQAIYRGEIQVWEEIDPEISGDIHAWVYPNHLSIQHYFNNILGSTGTLAPTLGIAPDPDAMVEAILRDPDAIGFLPELWPVTDLKIITNPAGVDKNIPVVGLISSETETNQRIWVDCLKKNLNQ